MRASTPNNYTRTQSQGHRPQNCHVGSGSSNPLDILFGIRDSGRSLGQLGQTIAKELAADLKNQDPAAMMCNGVFSWSCPGFSLPNSPTLNRTLRQVGRFLMENPDLVVGLVPVVGDVYDGISGALGEDLLTGRRLSNTDKTLSLAGAAVGLFTAGDEVASAFKLLSRAADKMNIFKAAKAAKGVLRLDKVVDTSRAIKNSVLRRLPKLEGLKGFGRKVGGFFGGGHKPVRGPDGLGLLDRWKQHKLKRWKNAGYDIDNPKIRRLIEEDKLLPEDVVRLYRGQLEYYPNVLSPAARQQLEQGASLEEAIAYSNRQFEGELAKRFRDNPEYALRKAGIDPAATDDDLALMMLAQKGQQHDNFPNPLIALTSDIDVARRYAADTGIVMEVVLPKKLVHDVDRRLGAAGLNVQNEAEYVIANHLPNKYITNFYFSPEVEAALEVLEKYEPEFAKLIRYGDFPVEQFPIQLGISGGQLTPVKLILSVDPRYPGSTAATLYEEIVHAFQGPMKGLQAEVEAKLAAARWVERNNIQLNPDIRSDRGIKGYFDKGVKGLLEEINDGYPDWYLKKDFPGGRFYQQGLNINQFLRR